MGLYLDREYNIPLDYILEMRDHERKMIYIETAGLNVFYY